MKTYSVRLKGREKFPWVVGHRGAMGHAPENTMTSFEEALQLGADMLEFDVRLSKDGIPVIVHDANLDRTSNKSVNVADLDAKDLLSLDAGSWFDLPVADTEPWTTPVPISYTPIIGARGRRPSG